MKSRSFGFWLFGLLGVVLSLQMGTSLSESALSASITPQQPPAAPRPGICEAWPLRVMPLGDSLTHGATVAGGYRTVLWDRLYAELPGIDFVGSQLHGPIGIDRDHEGHPGKSIQFIREEVRDWLIASQPNIILLMVGTNDVLFPEAHDYPRAAARLDALVGQITVISPTSELLVASIPVLAAPPANERASIFAQEVRAIATTRAAQGRRVTYVDMHSVLEPADLADGVHPNAVGYAKMADVWYGAIAQLLQQRCSSPQ